MFDVAVLGKALRNHRTQRGLTQDQLAQRTTVSVRTIRNLEAGRGASPRPGTVKLLVEGLELNLTDESAAELGIVQAAAAPAAWLAAMVCRATAMDVEAAREPVGRHREVRALTEIVSNGASRIVTICGLAGVGKSRTAMAVARELRRLHGTPWLWLPLADAGAQLEWRNDGDAVATAFSRWIRALVRGSSEAVGALTELVGTRPFILVCDGNDGGNRLHDKLLVELLNACPGLMIIETTRLAVPTSGRRVTPLLPLLVPNSVDRDAAGTEAHAAMRLMLECIRAVRPDVEVDADDLRFLGEICDSLDGVPRALASAARWFSFFPTRDVAEIARLDPMMLAESDRPAGPLVGWLSSALSATIDQLAEPQATLLGRLSEQKAPWTIDDVAQHVGDDQARALESMHALLAVGLIRPFRSGGREPIQFDVLRLVRAYLK